MISQYFFTKSLAFLTHPFIMWNFNGGKQWDIKNRKRIYIKLNWKHRS